MHVLLSLSSAVLYGAADFVGGLATRQANAIAVVVVSQLAGLMMLALTIPFFPQASPSGGDLAWGAAAGLAGGVGVALLYKALAIGTMGIVAPTTAVCAIAIPVLAGLALGEWPTPLALAGIVLAMVAIVLVSQQETTPADETSGMRPGQHLPPGMPHALLSGVAIGCFYVALSRTSHTAGMWPLIAARTTSVACFAIVAVVGGYALRMRGRAAPMSVGAGALDMLANVLYLVATRRGPLAIVVTLSSLYPASTVVLARAVLGERLSPVQKVGIGCALVAGLILVVGSRQ